MSKGVAVIGKAATAALAPYDDPDWDCWGLAWVDYPAADLLFDIHHPNFKADAPYDTHYNSHKNAIYLEKVNTSGIPVMCCPESEKTFINGLVYPLEEVEDFYPKDKSYLNCTVSYMAALAGMYAFKHGTYDRMQIFGTNWINREEFEHQVQGFCWLLGYLEGRGLKVMIHPGTPFMVSGYGAGRYGVDHEVRWRGR